MSESTLFSESWAQAAGPLPRTARWARDWLRRGLAALDGEAVELRDQEGSHHLGDPSVRPGVSIDVLDAGFYASLLRGGVLGGAESYMRGEWRAGDLSEVVRLMLRQQQAMWALESRLSRVAGGITSAWRKLRPNDAPRARLNAGAHYDLGNDFFAEFLDPTLMYSSGVFPDANATMEEASLAKLERLAALLQLRPEHHLLEIGTGWGGLALYMAAQTGCRVTTTTLSQEQYDVARDRIERAGLEDRVTLLLEDYRELSGRYDRLVSVEMIEAVGHEYLDTYLQVCSDRLTSDGCMAIQAILIQDSEYDRARREQDFIKRYIFPGGFLPSVEAISRSVARAGDLRWTGLEDITPHYAETLRRWRARFGERRSTIARMGYGEEFMRMWEFYLSYCEGGFDERYLRCAQFRLAKPNWRGDAIRRGRP